MKDEIDTGYFNSLDILILFCQYYHMYWHIQVLFCQYYIYWHIWVLFCQYIHIYWYIWVIFFQYHHVYRLEEHARHVWQRMTFIGFSVIKSINQSINKSLWIWKNIDVTVSQGYNLCKWFIHTVHSTYTDAVQRKTVSLYPDYRYSKYKYELWGNWWDV